MRLSWFVVVVVTLVVPLIPVAARAGTPPPDATPAASPPPPLPVAETAPPAAAERKIGVGYKIGNGLGFVGADVIVAPIEHLAFDLQINYLSESEGSEGTATGLGFAPAVQGRLFGGQRSTPFAELGWAHVSLSLNGVSASGSALFANVGYEWRWDFGLGLILGAGVAHLGTVSATNGITTVSEAGGTFFNLETGVRYMFF
jgi:hypothetical protein